MRDLELNKKTFWYCTYNGDGEIVNEIGNKTGERIPIYSDPVAMKANISRASGVAYKDQFGNLESYDKVLVTCDMSCPIDENSVLFIDSEPSYTSAETYNVIPANTVLGEDEINAESYQIPKYDYIVRRVARSINSISIAVRKVTVS